MIQIYYYYCNAKFCFLVFFKDCVIFPITEKFVSCSRMWSKTIVHVKAFLFLCALIIAYIWHANSLNTVRLFIGEKETCGETRVCDALSLGCTRLVRLSIICIRVVHVLYVHMWRIIYVLETNMPCVIGRDDGSVCLFISTNRCYYLVGEAFRFSYPDLVSCYSTCVSLFIMTCVVSFQI